MLVGDSPGIPSECGVMEGVESVVVREGNVGIVVDEEREHIVPLLGDGVVERGISLGILWGETSNPVNDMDKFDISSFQSVKE